MLPLLLTRVPGVSIQGGKYVFVRGLGDRYTKTQLMRMDIPGLDPDRNSLQMDIFPTNILQNIVVLKTLTADLPADFSGGLVNIELVDFPTKKTLNISSSLGYTPGMHLIQGLAHQGSMTDFLGFDSGFRTNPLPNQYIYNGIPNPALDNPTTTELTQSFAPVLAAQSRLMPVNGSLGSAAVTKSKGTMVKLSDTTDHSRTRRTPTYMVEWAAIQRECTSKTSTAKETFLTNTTYLQTAPNRDLSP